MGPLWRPSQGAPSNARAWCCADEQEELVCAAYDLDDLKLSPGDPLKGSISRKI